MRNTMLGAVGIAATAVLVAGCGAVPGLPISGTTANTGGSVDGPTTLVRFVVLTAPGSGPIDIVDINNPSKKFASGLKPGTVTDYLRVSAGLAEMDASGKVLSGSLAGVDTKKPRNTMVVGNGGSGPESQLFVETDGKLDTSATGKTMPSDKAGLVGSGLGFGKGAPQGAALTLGLSSGTCVKSVDGNGDHDTLGVASIPVWFAADPGSLELRWYGDPSCHNAATASAKVTVAAGKQAYVLPWLRDASHFGFLVVPISADGAGNAGVVDAGDGPAYSAPDSNSGGGTTTTTPTTDTPEPTTSDPSDG